jgi:DNA-binding ferritin-like protein (Dps family)
MFEWRVSVIDEYRRRLEELKSRVFEAKVRALAELEVLRKLLENDIYDLAGESFKRLHKLLGADVDIYFDRSQALLPLLDEIARVENKLRELGSKGEEGEE